MKKSLPAAAAAAVLLLAAGSASAATKTVCASGCDATTIQGGVSLAAPGDTVSVAAGTYNEQVTVATPNLTIQGAQSGQPGDSPSRTFAGPGESYLNSTTPGFGAFHIIGSGVTIDGFSISDHSSTSAASGVVVKVTANGTVITNNIISGVQSTVPATPTANGAAQGVYLEAGPDNVTITDNVMSDIQSTRSAKGVLIGDRGSTNPSTNVLIAGNTISGVTATPTRGAYGISQGNGGATGADNSGLQILNNDISDLNGAGWVHAIALEGPATGAIVQGNSVSDLTGPAGDTVGVWFEEDPYYATSSVNFNSLDVGSANVGIGVHPSLPAGSVDGTCNWWGSSSGPGPVGPGTGSMVSLKVTFEPWQTSENGDCDGGSARGHKHEALDDIAGIDDKNVNAARAKIQESLDRDNWDDNNHISGKKADQIFDLEKQAVKKLMDVKDPAPAGVAAAIDDLVTADRILAQTAIDDAAGGDPKKIASANSEMAKAQDDVNNGRYDSAVEHYKNAWKQAQKA